MALSGGLDIGRLVGRFHRGVLCRGVKTAARIPQAGFRLRPVNAAAARPARIC
jgi:hypothetical protein